MDSTLRHDQYRCDNCGEVRERSDVRLVGNQNIHQKDLLVFCVPDELDEVSCEDQFNHALKYDGHAVCNHCKSMMNLIVQTTIVINGKRYHDHCWQKHVRDIEEKQNRLPL